LPGDTLAKVTPKGAKLHVDAEEKLLRAIFGAGRPAMCAINITACGPG
jgi:hypothetical protein